MKTVKLWDEVSESNFDSSVQDLKRQQRKKQERICREGTMQINKTEPAIFRLVLCKNMNNNRQTKDMEIQGTATL